MYVQLIHYFGEYQKQRKWGMFMNLRMKAKKSDDMMEIYWRIVMDLPHLET